MGDRAAIHRVIGFGAALIATACSPAPRTRVEGCDAVRDPNRYRGQEIVLIAQVRHQSDGPDRADVDCAGTMIDLPVHWRPGATRTVAIAPDPDSAAGRAPIALGGAGSASAPASVLIRGIGELQGRLVPADPGGRQAWAFDAEAFVTPGYGRM